MEKVNRLEEIKRKDLPILRSIYTPNNIRSSLACVTIDNYIRWFSQNPVIENLAFYCLNGDFSDGTFVVIDESAAYAETNSESYENLSSLLRLIDCSEKRYTFTVVPLEITQIFRDALRKTEDECHQCFLYCLPKKEALNLNTESEDVDLRPVTELRDIVKGNSLWAKNYPYDTLPLYHRSVRNNLNVGAFTKHGTLASSAMTTAFGNLLGSLQTYDGFGGRGYGSLVVKHMSKRLAEMGFDTYAAIFKDNLPSLSMFRKIGFKPVGEVCFITTKQEKFSR